MWLLCMAIEVIVMAKKIDHGLLVAALVALVALVGLVTLFSGSAVTGNTMACQMVVTEAGVGSFLCRSDYVGPTFEPRYIREQTAMEKFDRLNWNGER